MFGHRHVAGAAGTSPWMSETELLLTEVNIASASARSAWIVLIALEAYFFVALAGIGHRDLLLNTPVAQPILQVAVPLRSFILFGPLVLIVMHAGVLQQHAILARKIKALHVALARDEQGPLSHPARLRVHSYYFAQIEAGPETSRSVRATFVAMDWLFLRLLPVGLLLAFQITYLPSHDTAGTWWHRGYIFADLLIIAAMSLYLMHLSKAFPPTALSRGGAALKRVVGLVAGMGVLAFSVAVATIPGEWADRTLASVPSVSAPVPYEGLGNISRTYPPGARGRRAFWPTAVLFEGVVDDWTRAPTSLFARNLIVMDEDLVPDGGAGQETSFSLRGRNLNFATFDRSDMHRVDLTDSSLKGASLVETNLEGARLIRVRMQGADLILTRLAGIEAEAVLLDGARICEGDTPLPLDYSAGLERVRCQSVGR